MPSSRKELMQCSHRGL